MKPIRRSTERRKAAVFLKAAELIGNGYPYSCNAIRKVARDWSGKAERQYVKLFEPHQVWHEPDEQQNNIRVLMLCFMAAITERP